MEAAEQTSSIKLNFVVCVTTESCSIETLAIDLSDINLTVQKDCLLANYSCDHGCFTTDCFGLGDWSSTKHRKIHGTVFFIVISFQLQKIEKLKVVWCINLIS